MYDSFHDFILALHKINAEAAKYLAKQCLLYEEGKPTDFPFSNNISPISEWKKYLFFTQRGGNLSWIMNWDKTPQRFEYWGDIYTEMKR